MESGHGVLPCSTLMWTGVRIQMEKRSSFGGRNRRLNLMNKKKGERPPRGYRCDFCQVNEPKHTINGGAWWICQACFDIEYGVEEE